MAYYVGTTQEDFLSSLSGNNSLVLNLDAGFRNSYSGSGSTWIDIAGTEQNATLFNSPSFVIDDCRGGCLSFNGTNQYATVPDVTGVTDFSLSSFTLNFWIKPTTTGISTQTIFDKGTNSYKISYYNNKLFFKGPTQSAIYEYIISNNNWNNIIITFEYKSPFLGTEIRPYSTSDSGNLFARGTIGESGGFSGTTSALNIGRSVSGTEYFEGKIALIQIYNSISLNVTTTCNAYKGRFGF